MARVLVFAGSARRDSLNKKLARVAADAARAAGGEVTLKIGRASCRERVSYSV